MLSRLETAVQEMAGNDYLVLIVFLCALLAYLLYVSWRAFERFRYMHATATSKIRSAAQGLVELKGLGELMSGDTILSPFSGNRCVWYHCTIEEKRRRGKNTTWINISDECSDHLFRLVDDTGECVVDPDFAHVVPETDLTWYASGPDGRNRPPTSRRLVSSLGLGRYRFRERLIRPATELYALGWFRTVYSNPSDELIAKEAEALVRDWKLQPQRYLRDYDLDGNGRIQKDEWKAIRVAARNQVMARMKQYPREHHVLSRPRDTEQPYILSACSEEELTGRGKLSAYTSIAGAFLIFSALVVMISIRAPLPV